MREILFKAKRIDNGEWVEGFYFCMVHEDGSHIHHFIMPLGVDLSLGTPIEKIQVEIDIDTLCQYTGLTDKNGNKIWENDLLLLEDRIVRIRWWKYSAGFDCICEKLLEGKPHIAFRGVLPQQYKRYEVIGNIFDNAELSEGHNIIDEEEMGVSKMENTKTNADYIRNMTDEELAGWFDNCMNCSNCPASDGKCYEGCKGRFLAWLQTERT